MSARVDALGRPRGRTPGLRLPRVAHRDFVGRGGPAHLPGRLGRVPGDAGVHPPGESPRAVREVSAADPTPGTLDDEPPEAIRAAVAASEGRRRRRGDRVRLAAGSAVGIVEGWKGDRVLVLWGVSANVPAREWHDGDDLVFVSAGDPYSPPKSDIPGN